MKKLLPLFIKFGIVVALVVTLLILMALKNDPNIAEAMTQGPVRVYAIAASSISEVVTFISFTELLFVFLFLIGVLLIVLFVINLVKKQPIKAVCKLFNIAIIALAVIDVYHFSCEASYNRKEMPLPYYENDVERTEYGDIYNYFASDLSVCINDLKFDENGDVKSDMSFDALVKEVKKAYKIVKDPYFHPHTGSVKPMLSSFAYREFQITGVTFSPFNEANINTLNTKSDLPYTIAHELAHTKGVMREDDANILAFYVCLNSDNTYLRFSAYSRYFYLISNMGSGTYLTTEERDALVKVDLSAYYKLNSYEKKYWEKHDLLKHIGDFINNIYIKSSGVQEGTSSYSSGTQIEYDPTQHRISNYNPYHKLFFEKYYR